MKAVISTIARGELKISGAKSLRTCRFLSRLRRERNDKNLEYVITNKTKQSGT